MKKAATALTQGSIPKNMLLFSVPLVCTNLLQVLFNMVDIAVAGHFAGTAALGSVGSTPQLLFLFTGILMGFGSGVNVTAAYFIGSKDEKSVEQTVHTAFALCLAAGILLMSLGIIFARPLLTFMDTKSDLIDDAVLYFSIYMLSMPASAIYNFGNGIFSANGDTKKPLYFLLVAGVFNVFLDLLLVITFGMGVRGIAFATVISQYISAILIMIFLSKGSGKIKFVPSKIKIERQKLIKLLSVGLPAGLQNAIFAFANVFVQIGVNSFDSVMVAGTSASANIDPVNYNFMSAFYVAAATFIAQNYGAGKKERVKKSYFAALFFSFSSSIILGTALFFFAREVMGIFSSDEAVIEYAVRRVKIMAFSYCISSFMDTAIASSRGFGKTLVPSAFVFLGSCVFRIAWIYTVFAHFRTIESLFLLYVFSWGITAVFETVYFIGIYKKSFPKNDL